MNLREQSKSFWWAIGSAAAMVLGAFAPWARVLGFLSVNGTDGDGWVVIGAAIVAVGVIVLRQRRGRGLWPFVVTFLAAVVAAAVAIHDWTDIHGFAGETEGLVDTAWGIYLATIGSVSLGLSSIALAVETRTHAPKTPSGVPRPSH